MGVRRLALLVVGYVAAAIVGAYAGARAGIDSDIPVFVLTGIVGVSGARATVRAWQSSSPGHVYTLEQQHMIVWVSTILCGMFGGIVWTIAGGESLPAVAVGLITGVAFTGWVTTYARRRSLPVDNE